MLADSELGDIDHIDHIMHTNNFTSITCIARDSPEKLLNCRSVTAKSNGISLCEN